MKTLIILFSLNAFIYGAYAVVAPILPSRSLGNTCANVCDCRYGPCQYEQGTSARSCTINGRSTDCCNYCTN